MRGFANIFGDYNDSSPPTHRQEGFVVIFVHYNGSRAFVDTFGIKVYDDLPSSLSLRGYINSFGTEVYFSFLDHFSSRGSPRTSVQTSTSATMATMTMSTKKAQLKIWSQTPSKRS
jgi:hypothetical protein